jgi:hypothetical protein
LQYCCKKLSLQQYCKKKNTMKKLLFIAALGFAAVACKKDDHGHDHGNDSELITTVRLTYTNKANITEKVVATWKDIDGTGGKAPEISTLNLKANTTYSVTTELLDESKTPSIDVTAEIRREATEHQLFYLVTGANLTHKYMDKDAKGFDLGLQSEHTTGAASTGKLRVVLKHLVGIKTATSTVNSGETDVDVEFPVVIQ